MDTHPHFSPEYHPASTLEGDSVRSKLESSIANKGIYTFIDEMFEVVRQTSTYGHMVKIAQDIETVHGVGSRAADGFLSGSAVAIDYISLFLPHILPKVDDKITQLISDYEREYRARNPFQPEVPTADKVTMILAEGNDHFVEHANNHSKILEDIRRAMHLEGESQRALCKGFGFTMEQAAWAYRTDMDTLKAESTEMASDARMTFRRSGNMDQPVANQRAPLTWFDREVEQLIATDRASHPNNG